MKIQNSKSPSKTGWGRAGILAAVLALLFWRSFLPGYVHFSNDGPLGQQNANWSKLPAAFTGGWDDLNGIGSYAGLSSPDPASLIRWTLGRVGYSKFLRLPRCSYSVLARGLFSGN